MKLPALLLLAVAACSELQAGPNEPSAQATTGVQFWIDPQKCYDLGTPNLGLRLFVDGALRRVDTLSIGDRSDVLGVTPGHHDVAAQEDYQFGFVWSQQITVNAGQVAVVTLGC